jgi:hypothetical protein
MEPLQGAAAMDQLHSNMGLNGTCLTPSCLHVIPGLRVPAIISARSGGSCFFAGKSGRQFDILKLLELFLTQRVNEMVPPRNKW